jgi:seryl-tRNA synthetase
MNDLRLVTEQPDRVRDSLRRRHAADDSFAAVDQIIELSSRRTSLVRERDELRGARNRLSREIGGLMREGRRDEAEAIKHRVHEGNDRISVIETEINELESTRRMLSLHLPNVLADDVPDGRTEEDNPVVRTWGTPRTFDFEPQPHVEVGTRLGILDLERSAKLSGARFAVLYGMGARLERALINFFLDVATQENGYEEVMVPYMVGAHALEGTGQLPKFEKDMFKLDEKLNGMDAYLIPTAEVPVTNLHRDEILSDDQLPVKRACFTPCFRSEAGSAGRDVRGLMRTHQFHKVELVWVTRAEDSDAAHEALVGHAESLLQKLELPYRVVRHCGGEVSFSARRCYDLEVWVPSQEKYREISSISNFGDFQARRMSLRYRPPSTDGKKSRPLIAHTLNGSGLAVGRTVVALLENGQQADGSVVLPEVLRPYMGVDVLRA